MANRRGAFPKMRSWFRDAIQTASVDANFDPSILEQVKALSNESGFDTLVERIGGTRLDTLINSPKSRNADYVFAKEKVIIELKIMESDPFDSEEFATKFNRFLLENPDYRAYNEIQIDHLSGLFRKKFRKKIADASDQIKSTKKELRYNDYKGVIVIINQGFGVIPSQIARSIITSLISSDQQFRAICGAMYISLNFEVTGTRNQNGSLQYVIPALVIENQRTSPSLQKFLFNLVDQWSRYQAEYGPLAYQETAVVRPEDKLPFRLGSFCFDGAVVQRFLTGVDED